ncbi:esterase family protein [Aureibaculum sp. A20]|uniref:Esterase family protein n=1 Tax=Aureibaculum flavum TaxID=2795986 RepID=A0ABS0WWF8_9FLAO|nr:alpha/beta hydrolase-fold protein [Aureibaculum flavum]MBJ2176329.1 esterase family protein [Aureibaculum flavum]
MSGKVIYDRLYSKSLENNGGENPTRRVTIYLPPDYDETTNRYPVIYYLHGFTWSDSLQVAYDHFDKLLDKAIIKGIIKPVIVVMPDEHTLYRGSWYTNSSLTGKWADFTGIDLVTFIDKKYRTLPNWESRGVAGHSMGGQGAIKMGMLFPHVFSSVYALSPATLGIAKEIGIKGEVYKRVQEIKTREELVTGWDKFYPNAIVAMGRTYSPNLNNPPFYADLPFTYKGDSLIINNEVLELWHKKSVIGMADKYVESLRMLKALKLDWGRNEWSPHIPLTCRIFSQKLENWGVNHYAEEYIGTHGNKLWTDDGRALNDMLPFFDTYLEFD